MYNLKVIILKNIVLLFYIYNSNFELFILIEIFNSFKIKSMYLK